MFNPDSVKVDRDLVGTVGAAAAFIGTVREDAHHFVTMETQLGGHRMVDWLSGEQLPRIC